MKPLASVGWAKRSLPATDLQFALTLTWARCRALLPILPILRVLRERIFFRVKLVSRRLALGGLANSMTHVKETPDFPPLTGAPPRNFVAA
jgi:hypothetical protein